MKTTDTLITQLSKLCVGVCFFFRPCLRALVALILAHLDENEAHALALLVLLEGEEGTKPDRHEDRQTDSLAGNISGR